MMTPPGNAMDNLRQAHRVATPATNAVKGQVRTFRTGVNSRPKAAAANVPMNKAGKMTKPTK